jgi:hypothetical protein
MLGGRVLFLQPEVFANKRTEKKKEKKPFNGAT